MRSRARCVVHSSSGKGAAVLPVSRKALSVRETPIVVYCDFSSCCASCSSAHELPQPCTLVYCTTCASALCSSNAFLRVIEKHDAAALCVQACERFLLSAVGSFDQARVISSSGTYTIQFGSLFHTLSADWRSFPSSFFKRRGSRGGGVRSYSCIFSSARPAVGEARFVGPPEYAREGSSLYL